MTKDGDAVTMVIPELEARLAARELGTAGAMKADVSVASRHATVTATSENALPPDSMVLRVLLDTLLLVLPLNRGMASTPRASRKETDDL